MTNGESIIDQKKKVEERILKNRVEYEKAKKAIRLACKDPNGQIIIRHLAKICGFFKPNRVMNLQTGDINPWASIHNEGRREVYVDIRRMMTDEDRRQIESRGE